MEAELLRNIIDGRSMMAADEAMCDDLYQSLNDYYFYMLTEFGCAGDGRRIEWWNEITDENEITLHIDWCNAILRLCDYDMELASSIDIEEFGCADGQDGCADGNDGCADSPLVYTGRHKNQSYMAGYPMHEYVNRLSVHGCG